MATCDQCGRHENLPYNCRHCGGTYCSEHRLPENHACPGLDNWNDPKGIFASDFDDSARYEGGRSESVFDRVGVNTGTGGPLGYFRGNMTYVFLGLMWIWFIIEIALFPLLVAPQNSPLWRAVFVLTPQNPEFVWTWITSIFSHGGFTHIAINSIVLYFFGPIVERRVGSTKFVALFLGAGMVAGLAQIGATIIASPGALGGGVVGASGAIAALMGVLTVLNPNLRIYLYFIIPMPLWIATALFAGYSALVSASFGIGAGGVAQLAHLSGLGIGLLYGYILKQRGESAPEQLQFGGGGGRGPGRGRGPF
ncbi:rhomboid family intramembrane serine protease [Haladaptatus sp. DYSN1]|uniref:rhomboid family intramembrane serine protease n=1 Tax=unclassified Haladaptatus TaxID=2622732 RepID=UPI00240601C5|nr:rhomboid family intramembrane serine protease [Haladaptatus sp. DYSN1]